MKILTLRRPWASLLITDAALPLRKDVENRTRNVAGAYRGTVAIHSGHEIDRKAREPYAADNFPERISALLPAGAIIGTVELVDVHKDGDCFLGHRAYDAPTPDARCSPWALADHYHLVTANPRELATPIPYRGFLGLRDLPDDIAAQILDTPSIVWW